ncbi:MAG TPA: hypothetical protein VLT33_30040, partial [Labilithrix sp.]|nr:hypothetical protein [Labilithrix sp.]
MRRLTLGAFLVLLLCAHGCATGGADAADPGATGTETDASTGGSNDAARPGTSDAAADAACIPDDGGKNCPCVVTDPVDEPTLAMTDRNCDGIVGNAAGAVFVDGAKGSDINDGSMKSPKQTIMAGIAAAKAATPPKAVYISKGTYAETLVLADGVSIYGGYDASAGWARGLNLTAVESPAAVGVVAQNLTKPTEIQFLVITAANAGAPLPNGDGASSVGVQVTGSSGVLTIRGCVITAGAGGAGAVGTDTAVGAAGGNGGPASGTLHGAPGLGCQGANGGLGADAVSGPSTGNAGGAGVQAAGGGARALGGGGGGSGSCDTFSSSSGDNAPPVSAAGGAGAPGTMGVAGPALGTVDTLGRYVPNPGGDGLSAGMPGGGGGGGGSGGGSARGTNFFCTNCSAVSSGAGGGGGGGGCGGGVGRGGRGGGGSFGIVASGSAVIIDESKMITQKGGNGGNGGAGALGGPGGGG